MLTRAIGVAIPAHDEAALLPASLRALRVAASQHGVPDVRIIVIADSCRDHTAAVARAAGVEVVEVRVSNAGAARAEGLDLVVRTRSVALAELWLATTDADSEVPVGWFTEQLRLHDAGYDAVAGTVLVSDWSDHVGSVRDRFVREYGAARQDHPHVHGANLGLSARAYVQIDGFPRLALSEDHELVAALQRCGLRTARTGNIPVRTSARPDYRAARGFGALLERFAPAV